MKNSLINCLLIVFIFLTLAFGWEKDGGCHNDTIRLECDSSEDIIVVQSALYSTEIKDEGVVPKLSCLNSSVDRRESGEKCTQDLRLLFNSKCSGLNFCRFNINRDLKTLSCNNTGFTFVSYRCVPKKSMKRFCGEDVTDHEGFIISPGYPNYYPPLSCNWTIKVKPQQQIELSILDLSIKPVPKKHQTDTKSETYEKNCEHYVRVMDSRRRALHICGQSPEKLKPVKIHSSNVTIILQSDGYWSARGFLMHYRVIGCTELSVPKNGYLVHKSDSMATYMCCIDYVFPDSLDNTRELFCENEFKWNKTLPDCVAIEKVEKEQNLTEGSLSEFRIGKPNCGNNTQSQGISSFVIDIIIPSIIIGTLIVLNGLIVIYLLHKRRKLKETLEDEEFLQDSTRQREPSTSVTSATTSYG